MFELIYLIKVPILSVKNKLITLVLYIVLIVILSSSLPFTVEASHKTFEEDFSDTLDGDFPVGWELANDPGGSTCSNTWKVEDGILKIPIVDSSCTTNIMPSDSKWDDLGDDYIFDIDATFVSGTDHNVAFRFVKGNSANDWYDLHFQSPNDFIIERLNFGTLNTYIPQNYPNKSEPYHIRIVVNGKNIKVYVDGTLVRDYTSATDAYPHGRIALRASGSSETHFDNIKVTSLDDLSNLDLAVPLLKQTDPSWGDQIYDSANIWAANSPGISSWGCAMTSAAMVFQFHGIKKLPDGNDLNPANLNTWLKDQPDGYIGSGLVNWLALSRLSRIAKENNPDFNYDALEYNRVEGANTALLMADLQNNFPSILEEPGHFIVGKGVNANGIFTINDPYFERENLSFYNNTFLSLGRYVPSNTDLSYFMIVVDSDVDIKVNTVSGEVVGESFIQNPYDNAILNNGTKSGSPVKIYYVPKPTTGSYTFTLSSTKSKQYTFHAYLYDMEGDVSIKELKGFLSKNTSDSFSVYFEKENINTSQLNKVVTFQSMIDDITNALNLKLIVPKSVANTIISQLKNAQKDSGKNRKITAGERLQGIKTLLDKLHPISIKDPAYEILLYDVQYLLQHL